MIIGVFGPLKARSEVGNNTSERVLYLHKKPGVDFWRMLQYGGMYRKNDNYLILSNGITDFVSLNAVSGFSLGPQSVFGKVLDDGARLELAPSLKYSFDRDRFWGQAALRYYFSVQKVSMIEFSGGRIFTDFNRCPMMNDAHAELVGALFAWNHQKYYDLTYGAVQLYTPLHEDLQTTFRIEWQQRSNANNCRKRNLFGNSYQSNYPNNYLHSKENWADDPVMNFKNDDQWVWKIKFDYRYDSKLYVKDDMTSELFTRYPMVSLSVEVATPTSFRKDNNLLRYGWLECALRQSLESDYERWQYYAAMGIYFDDHQMYFPDYKHFVASDFVWQESHSLKWFSLISNYEYSTGSRWIEVHNEFSSTRMLIGRLLNSKESKIKSSSQITEFIQLHTLQVPHTRFYTELVYGWDLWKKVRIGGTVGFRGVDYEGVALQLVLNLKNWDK